MSRHVWASIASLALALGSLYGAWWWLKQEAVSPAIDITAALDVPEHGLPVYAQFTMMQTLSVADPIKVTQLTVPVYFPEETGEPLVIELWRYDTLISRWRYQPEKFGAVIPVALPLVPAQLLDGKLSVRFAAESLAPEDQAAAARLFVQSADAYYPEGNYSIAQNQKSGDIALTLYAETQNLDRGLRELEEQPLRAAAAGSRWLLLAAVIVAAPYSVARPREDSLVG